MLQRCVYETFSWLQQSELVGTAQNVTYLHKPVLSRVFEPVPPTSVNICTVKCTNVTHKDNAIGDMILVVYCSRTKHPKFSGLIAPPVLCDVAWSGVRAQLCSRVALSGVI